MALATVNLLRASSRTFLQRCFSQCPILLSRNQIQYEDRHREFKRFTASEFYQNPKLLLDAFKTLGKEIWGLKDDIWKSFNHEVQFRKKHEIDMFFTFEEDASINDFVISTDSKNNEGYSTASFVRTESNSGYFSGNIVTKPPDDGKTQFAGYATIMSKRPKLKFNINTCYDLSKYTHLVMKIRGDGRSYLVILWCAGYFDVDANDQFHFPLFTRGGPYWQLVKIPFSNFYFTSRGKVQDQQEFPPLFNVTRFGITLGDGIDGPFHLEIDYIGLEHQPLHKNICVYEHYRTGAEIIRT